MGIEDKWEIKQGERVVTLLNGAMFCESDHDVTNGKFIDGCDACNNIKEVINDPCCPFCGSQPSSVKMTYKDGCVVYAFGCYNKECGVHPRVSWNESLEYIKNVWQHRIG